MKLYDAGLTILILVFVLTVGGSMVHKLSNKPHHTGKEEFKGHDDFLEENIELVIEVLGAGSQDLTPESPEKD